MFSQFLQYFLSSGIAAGGTAAIVLQLVLPKCAGAGATAKAGVKWVSSTDQMSIKQNVPMRDVCDIPPKLAEYTDRMTSNRLQARYSTNLPRLVKLSTVPCFVSKVSSPPYTR